MIVDILFSIERRSVRCFQSSLITRIIERFRWSRAKTVGIIVTTKSILDDRPSTKSKSFRVEEEMNFDSIYMYRSGCGNQRHRKNNVSRLRRSSNGKPRPRLNPVSNGI